MDRDPDAYDRRRFHSLNGGLYSCEEKIVDMLLAGGTDMLEKWIQEILEGADDQKSARYADALLADFVRHCVPDGFRKVEAPMRAAYEAFVEALQKREGARLATEQATHAWEVLAEDFRPKLKVLGQWANSAALLQVRRRRGFEPNPFLYARVLGTSNGLRTPDDFVKNHDSVFREINFIREVSETEVLAGRLERPVRMSDFELSLKALKAAQACVEVRQNEEADAKDALEPERLKYCEERQKAIAVLGPLSEAGKWALFYLVRDNTESS